MWLSCICWYVLVLVVCGFVNYDSIVHAQTHATKLRRLQLTYDTAAITVDQEDAWRAVIKSQRTFASSMPSTFGCTYVCMSNSSGSVCLCMPCLQRAPKSS